MYLIYRKDTGQILRFISVSANPLDLYYHYDDEFKNNLAWFVIDKNDVSSYQNGYIKNEQFIPFTSQEIYEIQQYKKILTNEERVQYKKSNLINASKSKLAIHLQTNPLQYIDGKYYSVTAEKQNLLSNAIAVYQMKMQSGLPAELKWNSTGEECTIWTLEGITALALTIASYVEPLVTYQQALEVQIRNCTTVEELDEIVIDYATV